MAEDKELPGEGQEEARPGKDGPGLPNSPGDGGARPGGSPDDPLAELFRSLGDGSPGGSMEQDSPAGGQASGFPGSFPGMPGLPGGFPAGGFGPEDLQRMMGGMGPEDLQRMMGGMQFDPAMLGQIFQQVSAMFSSPASEGPVNWTLAHDGARRVAAENGDPSVDDREARNVDEALKLADLWLNQATRFPSSNLLGQAWSKAQWVEKTLPTWKSMAEPLAVSISTTLTAAISEQLPEEMKGMLGGAESMLANLGGSLFGMQFGQAVGRLAQDVLGSSDIGIPLVENTMALVPGNIERFSQGLGVPAGDVRLYLAVREAAHARLFLHAPWLRQHILGAVQAFAQGIRIDTGRIEELARDLDPTQPETFQAALNSGDFLPEQTPEQKAALAKLETAMALIEGWVDVVTDASTAQLPPAAALRETMRRRRATGGPAEQAMASLVGLELRPRRLRDAAELWRVIAESRGIDGRDALWEHPDLLPTSEDLDDPQGFESRHREATAATAEIDQALSKLFAGGFDGLSISDDGTSPTQAEDPDDSPDGQGPGQR